MHERRHQARPYTADGEMHSAPQSEDIGRICICLPINEMRILS
jgi:hypothetical protein